jgi:hypothetical protein
VRSAAVAVFESADEIVAEVTPKPASSSCGGARSSERRR